MFGLFKMIGIGFIAFITILGISFFAIEDSPKDKIINTYDSFIQTLDITGITKDDLLKGTRKFGIDKYVGNYTASYDKCSGEEIIFGGTALHRKNGDHINLKIKVEKQDGNIEVKCKLGNNEISLINDTGEYEDAVYIDGVSYYLIIKLDNFKGNIDIVAE